jgi:hypothetical protein
MILVEVADREVMDVRDVSIGKVGRRVEHQIVIIATIEKNIYFAWCRGVCAKAVANVEYRKRKHRMHTSVIISADSP